MKTPPPILRVLDEKKQIVGTQRSRKHNLQHPYAPKFATFHGKNGQKWPFFGQNLSLLASDKQLKTNPYFKGAGCEKESCSHTQITKTQLQHAYAPKFAIFHEKTAKNGRFWSTIEFFGLRQAVEDPPPIFRVLDAKKQVVGIHRSRTHTLQHAYAPKCAIFHEENGQKWAFFGHILRFFGLRQAVEDHPPYFQGAGCEKAGCRHTQITKKICSMRMHEKVPFFMKKTAKNGRFLVKN